MQVQLCPHGTTGGQGTRGGDTREGQGLEHAAGTGTGAAVRPHWRTKHEKGSRARVLISTH